MQKVWVNQRSNIPSHKVILGVREAEVLLSFWTRWELPCPAASQQPAHVHCVRHNAEGLNHPLRTHTHTGKNKDKMLHNIKNVPSEIILLRTADITDKHQHLRMLH